jgi:hypothetical protein
LGSGSGKNRRDKYAIVFENELARVLEYRDQPGEKKTLYAHRDFDVVARSACKRQPALPGGKTMAREFQSFALEGNS